MRAKQRDKLRLQHRVLGSGIIRRGRYTDAGTAVFDVRFEDGRDRTLLAAAEFWLSSEAEVEKAFAQLLEVKPEIAIPQGARPKRTDISLPTPAYGATDDTAEPYEVTDDAQTELQDR